ncbi:MAG: hypothetical protein ABSB22_20805 [Thermodesulfobacteriota bacterium]|jgi:hypothetical protein
MSISDVLDKAYEAQITKLYEIFFESVGRAQDKESEMTAAGERFKKGVDLLKKVLARAKEITAT